MTVWTGRDCLVTGGAQGIGAAIVRSLADRGARVAFLDLDVAKGTQTAAELSGTHEFVACDLSEPNQVEGAIHGLERAGWDFEVLVNNAGISSYADATIMTVEEWDRFFAVDLRAVWLCSRAVLPRMRERGRGSIVNVASIHSRSTLRGMFPYAAAKAGVVGLTRSLALDEGPNGIRVNCVSPGYTRTQLVDEYFDRQVDAGRARREVNDVHALGRISEPSEVADAVVFLAGGESSAITGTDLVVDCGHTARFA